MNWSAPLSLTAARIVYLGQEKIRVPVRRETLAYAVARGHFVAFLDGDDTYFPAFLSEQLELIRGHGGYDLVYADCDEFWLPSTPDGSTNMDVNPSRGAVDAEGLIRRPLQRDYLRGTGGRDLIVEVGLFDETLRNSQDFDLWIRLAKHGARFNYQRKVLGRQADLRRSLASDPVKSFTGELQVLERQACVTI